MSIQPVIRKKAVLIDNVGTSPDGVAIGTGGIGRGVLILQDRNGVGHSVIEIGSAFYVVVLTSSYEFQMYRSTDQGETWSTYGSPLSPTVPGGGGMETWVQGDTINLFYSRNSNAGGHDYRIFLCAFDTVGGTWGTEDSYDLGDTPLGGVDFRVEGPYAAIERPDGSVVLPLNDLLSGYPCFVTYDSGTWAGPFVLRSIHRVFESWTIRPDGTVDLFYAFSDGLSIGVDAWVFEHVIIETDDSFSFTVMFSGLALAFSPVAWSDNGLGWGYEKDGDFFLACGKEDPVNGPQATGGAAGSVWGNPAIAFGNDGGGWTVGARIDTASLVDGYSMISCALHLFEGVLIYVWRGIDAATATSYIERVGWALEGSHNTPAAWTFVTIYDYDSPDPAVPGQTEPYRPADGSRSAYAEGHGLSVEGDKIRIVTTMTDVDDNIFAAYLFEIEMPTYGNEFRVGSVFLGQGA